MAVNAVGWFDAFAGREIAGGNEHELLRDNAVCKYLLFAVDVL